MRFLLIFIVVFFPYIANSQTILFDGFESGNLSTNTGGFSWEAPNRTSIVTGGVGSNQVVYPTPAVVNDSRDWSAKSGSNSLRFRYPANEAMAEQRFSLGTHYTELWFSYWIRVPVNYAHTVDSGALNNKFFSLWMDAYVGEGSAFWLSMESAGGGDTNLAFTYSLGNNTGDVGMQQHAPFIDSSEDRGKWMHIVFHVKAESSDGADDGIIETWRKWDGESSYTKLHDAHNIPFQVAASPAGFQNGYVLGWANAEYTEDTEWLVDDFTISTTSLLAEATPVIPTVTAGVF